MADLSRETVTPLPKPQRREPSAPKPLQRKTPLRPYQIDKNGLPVLKPKQPKTPKKRSTWAPPSKLIQRPPKAPKVDLLWQETRSLWFEYNPPDLGDDYYQCQLCPFPVHKDEVTLDHIKPKGSNPKLKYDLANLQAAHARCNYLKGSMSMEQYKRVYHLHFIGACGKCDH